MSWLKAITGGVIGAEALSLVKEYVEKEAGLDAVVKNFQNGGFKRQVDLWISTGKNQAISGIEVGQAIGIEKIKKLAESAGIDINKARDLPPNICRSRSTRRLRKARCRLPRRATPRSRVLTISAEK